MQYRRAKINGGTFFFTLVTYKRRKILCKPNNINLLRKSFRYVMTNHLFTIDAIVILRDHLHCIWTLLEGDRNFLTRWRLIKSEFSRRCDSKLFTLLKELDMNKLNVDRSLRMDRLFYVHSEEREHWILSTPEKKVLSIGPGDGWSYDSD